MNNEETLNEIPKVCKKYFGNKELRILEGNSKFIFVTRDICDILGASYYHMSKLPTEHCQLIAIKTKAGAIQKTYVCDFQAIKLLLNIKPNNEFQQWLHSKYPNNFEVDLVEDPNESTSTINNLAPDNIKLLNNALEILNSGNKENVEILKSLLNGLGLIKKGEPVL